AVRAAGAGDVPGFTNGPAVGNCEAELDGPGGARTNKEMVMGIEAFRYDGKRALVVGGATGMGAATARILQDIGADVVVMDYAPVTQEGVQYIQVDLRDQASIDAAIDQCGGPVHAIFACAGVADGTEGIE